MERMCTSSGPSANWSARPQPQMLASGVSGETPMAPKVWIARLVTVVWRRGQTTLIIEISLRAALAPTLSIIQAVFNTSRRACSISTRESAIHSATVPCSCRYLPKVLRSAARSHISSSAKEA